MCYTSYMARPTTEQRHIIKGRNDVIKDLFLNGTSQADIAKMLNISRAIVNQIVSQINIATEEEIKTCLEWLKLQKIIKTPNKRYHSYHLKHVVERWHGDYISNDSFVEAIKRADINYELCGESGRYIYAAISTKTIKETDPQELSCRFKK